jgi:hypothetical protein
MDFIATENQGFMNLPLRQQAEAVVAELMGGVEIDRVFLQPAPGFPTGCIWFWHPEIGLREVLLRENELDQELYHMLKEQGAKQVESVWEIWLVAHENKWTVLSEDVLKALRG